MVVAQLLEPDTNQLKEKDHCIASLHINWIWRNTKNCWNQTNQTIYQLNSDTTVLFNIRGPKFWTNCIFIVKKMMQGMAFLKWKVDLTQISG